MPAREEARAPRERARRVGRRRLRALWAVAFLGIAVYVYYRPLASYLETRRQLEGRRSEVAALVRAREDLRIRLATSTSTKAIEREARRLGYVKPGEQLFVVKGIPAWRAARAASREHAAP